MQFSKTSNSIVVNLPITTPTGKIRVKRPSPGLAASPVACRSEPIADGDYLEWQISYDTDDMHEPSIVKEVILQKKSGTRYGCELVRLLVEGLKLKLVSELQVNELKGVMKQVSLGIEESDFIRREAVLQEHSMQAYGFTRYNLLVPNYVKEAERYAVEVKIAHKQKAVGNQAMIYLNLPAKTCRDTGANTIVGRIAERNELVDYTIDRSNSGLIFDAILAFVVASGRHRDDMVAIFEALNL